MTGHPDVLVIGPTRAGTSWLNWAFSHHPDAWVPYFKELHYFNVQKHKHFNKFHAHHRVQLGRKWSKLRSRGKWPPRDEVVWMAKYFFMPRSDRWYQSLFPKIAPPIKVRVECTPKYCLLPDAEIANILRINPEMKVIYILRNPVDRAWSILARRHGRKMGRALDSYSEAEIAEFFSTIGEEHRHLNRTCLTAWQAHLPKDRICVSWFDALQDDPMDFLEPISRFVGIDLELFRAVKNLTDARNSTGAQRPTGQFPEVSRQMAAWYMDDIDYVAETYGGHALTWQADARALLGRGVA